MGLVEITVNKPICGRRTSVQRDIFGDTFRDGAKVEVWTRDLQPGDGILAYPDADGIEEVVFVKSIRVISDAEATL